MLLDFFKGQYSIRKDNASAQTHEYQVRIRRARKTRLSENVKYTFEWYFSFFKNKKAFQ